MCERLTGTLYIVERNRINWSSHPRCRLDDGGDGRGILSERVTQLKQLALFGHANSSGSAHSVFQFSLSLY